MLRRARDLHYGWAIVAALSVTETISWGIIYYSFPVFLQAMERDLGASRVAITGALSVGLGVSALAAVPVGWWLDRFGPRALMTAGSCLAAILLIAWSRVESLGALYLVWCAMGLAMAATLYEPAFAAVVQWFARHRDRALLIVTLAAGLASTIFMPVAAWLLGRQGWRTATLTLAITLALTTIPIHAVVLRRPPRAGREPDRGPATPAIGGRSLHAALRSVVFWVLAGVFAVGTFTTTSISVHLIPYLTQHGYSAQFAAVAVGWMGAMQLLGRLLFLPVASRLGPVGVTASVCLTQGAAMALLAIAVQLGGLAPAIVLLGAANGMATLARATTVVETFGRRYYGSIGGAIAVAANSARALGPV
ncbi:MAG TPA: MFS transporter, partial [bacterium]|nr:MFS transporter [bacterium]